MNFNRGRVLIIEGPDLEANIEQRNAIACGRFEPVPATPENALMLADQVDCLIMDGAAPGADEPLRLLSELWCVQPDLPVIVIIDGDRVLKERALRAGVAAVLTTPFTELELRASLLMALQQRDVGLSAFTREIARTMSSVATALEEANGLQGSIEEIAGLFHVKRASVMLYEDAIGAQAWGDLAHAELAFEGVVEPKEPETNEAPEVEANHDANKTVGPSLRVAAHVGLPKELAPRIRVPTGCGIAGNVAKEGIPRLLLRRQRKHFNEIEVAVGATDKATIPRSHAGDSRKHIHAGICVPIRAAGERGHGQVLGVLSISRVDPGEIFTPRDLEICEFLAAHIGQVLSRRRLDDDQADLQQRLAATEKLSYAGELAAGIAHEVASPISYVRANVRTLSEYLEELGPLLRDVKLALQTGESVQMTPHLEQADDLIEVLDDMKDLVDESRIGMERATQIVNDMKAMVRIGGTDEPMVNVDVTSLIESSLRLLRPRLLDACVVDTELESNLVASGHEVELSQVLVNLVVNASDACAERAATIAEQYRAEHGVDDVAAIRKIFQPRVQVRTEKDVDVVVIYVKDNGVGIPQKKVQSIFAPLFTTKPKGVGTGLGLGIVQRIVSAHDGRIEVTSEVGVGTTFRITIPLGVCAPTAIEVGPTSFQHLARNLDVQMMAIDDADSDDSDNNNNDNDDGSEGIEMSALPHSTTVFGV